MIDKKNTKQMIIENSIKLFYKNGYEKTTMRKIAEVSGIAHPSIFSHFKNKAEIAAVQDSRYIRGLLKMTKQYIDQNENTKQKHTCFMFYWTAHYYYVKKEGFNYTSENLYDFSSDNNLNVDCFTQVLRKIINWEYQEPSEEFHFYSNIIYAAMKILTFACYYNQISIEKAIFETFKIIYAVVGIKSEVSKDEIKKFVNELDYKKYLNFNLLEDVLLTDFGEDYVDLSMDFFD